MTTEYVNRPDLRILTCLWNLAHHHAKTYCWPNVETIASLLTDHYQITLSPRTIWRHIGALRRDGWLITQCRHRKKPNGELELHSNLYKFRVRTYDFFATAAAGTKRLVDNFRAKYRKNATTTTAQHSTTELHHKSIGDGKRSEAASKAIDALRARMKRNI